MENRDMSDKTGKAGTWIFCIILFTAAFMTGILLGEDGQLTVVYGALSVIPDEFEIFRVLLMALFLAALIWFCFGFQVILHEAGHLVFGLLTGYRFVSFRIGSLMLVKKNEKLCLKRYSLKGTGGQCLMAPPEPYREELPYFWYHMGGSVANFVMSIICIAGYAGTRQSPVSLLFLCSALFGILTAAMNGIPRKAGQLANDGYYVLGMKRNAGERWYAWLQLAVNAKLADGKRLKDMPEEWFELPEPEEMDDAMGAAAGIFVYLRALDGADFDKAEEIGRYLRDNAEGMIGLHKGMLFAEMLFLELVGKNRKEETEALITDELKLYLKATKKLPSTIRVLYAYDLLAKNEEEAAENRRKLFEKKARRYPNECEIRGERELMDFALNAYRKGVGKMEDTNTSVKIAMAKKSFERALDSNKYRDIIKDNGHLELLLSMIEFKDMDTVIDIGTGNGYLAFPLAEKYPEIQVYGIDIAETIIRKNNEKAESKGIRNVTFVPFDGLTYPFKEASADVIVTRFALHHFPEIERAAEQMVKILKPGGRLLISDPGRHQNDRNAVIDSFMGVKGDGHIRFYTIGELDQIFIRLGMKRSRLAVTQMSFPFPDSPEYRELFEQSSQEERECYRLQNRDGIIWVGEIAVNNVVYESSRKED